MDEGHYAWQLESPAGVDGMPSPDGISDVRTLAIGKKGGRIIPAILGAANTPVTSAGTTVLTPSTAGNKPPCHRPVSSADSSIGTGSAGWEMEPSFGASQVAAFVADAQAEAAAEAQAAVVEAQAEAAEEEAAEEKARAEQGGTTSEMAAATPALAKIAARFSPINAAAASAPAPTTFVAESSPLKVCAMTPAGVTARPQSPATAAAAAAMAAATAAAEADAAAEDAAAAAEAAKEAAAAEAAWQRGAEEAAKHVVGEASVTNKVRGGGGERCTL